MTTKKKITPQTVSGMSTAAAAAVAKKAPRTSSAATHKSSGRKSAAKTASTSSVKGTFDASAHHSEIADVAYYLWLDGGSPCDTAVSDWHRAVEIVSARYRSC